MKLHPLFHSKKPVHFERLYQYCVRTFGWYHYPRALLRADLDHLKKAGKIIEIIPNYFIPLQNHRRTHLQEAN